MTEDVTDARLRRVGVARRKAPSAGTWIPISLIVLVWVTLLPRIIPVPQSDRGIFVSVAERLLAGDRLYQTVWDNKDPLFYFSIAIGRAVSPYADIFLELFWILGSAAGVYVVAKWLGCGRVTALLLAFGMTPLILTGFPYLPGFTHLPGIALTLLAMAAAVSHRFILAGSILALLAFTKVLFLPIAGLIIVVVIIVRRSWRDILQLAVGGFSVTGGVIGVLQLRGELQPYLQSLLLNVSYSQGGLATSEWGPFIGRLLRMASVETILVVAAVLIAILLAFWGLRRQDAGSSGNEQRLILWSSAASSLVGAVIVLGLTGLWPHHAQILFVAEILVVVGIAYQLKPKSAVRPLTRIALLTLLAVFAALLLNPGAFIKSVTDVPQALTRLGTLSPEAKGVLSVGQQGSYARVGQNDDEGHAYGLRGWSLSCPRFHQYYFDSPMTLAATLDCLPKAEVIIVSASAIPIAGWDAWNAYLQSTEALLRDRYSCNQQGEVRVCVRADG